MHFSLPVNSKSVYISSVFHIAYNSWKYVYYHHMQITKLFKSDNTVTFACFDVFVYYFL